MLLDDAERLRKDIEGLATLRTLAKEAGAFDTRANQLEQVVVKLAEAIRVLELLRAQGVPITFSLPSAFSLQKRAEQLLSGFRSDARHILETEPPLEVSFLAPVRKVAADLTGHILAQWQARVDERLPRIPPDVLVVLASVSALHQQVSAIQIAQQTAQKLRANLPSGSASFTELEHAIQAANKAWGEIGGGGLPEPVLKFFRKVVARSARLDDLNDDVLNWLRARDLLNAFSIAPV